jgi:pyruvate/2-oxoglutarate dehydrogenase complex dihydrolipoamide acyltransferase (E2) component
MVEKHHKLSSLQKAMSRHMTASWTNVPQFQLETEVDCGAMISFRKELIFKPSYTSIISKAIAVTLSNHPYLNASWADDHIVTYENVNLGIAMDTARGLLVPIVFNIEKKSLEEVNIALEGYKQKSQRGNFSLNELTGGTFTISNLGMYRITSFTSIVNSPQVAILAIPRIIESPSIFDDGTIGRKRIMRPVLTLDHRVVDGVTAARFLEDLVTLLEEPEKMI